MHRFVISLTAGGLLLGANPVFSDRTLSERQRALHVLNRLAFGPRPGDVDRVVAMGMDKWIDQQLHPERIADTRVEAKLAKYETISMTDRELFAELWKPMMEAKRARKRDGETGRRGDGAMRKEMMKVPLELTAAKLDRALESNRQLNEVMVDFWLNHFNVFAGKGLDRVLIASYERDTIRPHIWGKFDDLLMATAKSPAMLVYLDNARSIAPPENRGGEGARGRGGARATTKSPTRPLSPSPTRPLSPSPTRNQGGLNENYARELLELHTLGVDGGYTQKDVTELARLLTGWSIARPTEGGSGFVFRARLHDSAAKTILGKRFPGGGGLSEGEAMIRYLGNHPSTAKHLARKLCQRLVADEPPQPLVDRVAARFLETRGDLRETVREVVTSPEFFAESAYRSKVKSPFEYVVSAIRATGGTSANPLALAKILKDMGQPLYFSQPPTGYADDAATWVNTGALMSRINFALALAADKIPGTTVKLDSGSVESLAWQLTGGDLSTQTRKTIEERLQEEPVARSSDSQKARLITGLILGSPEFQRQ